MTLTTYPSGLHSVTPTDDDEVAAVLRHRLFESVDEGVAAKVAEEYQSYYRDFKDELPDRVTKAEFRDQLERTYPFHPTLIDLLGKRLTHFQASNVHGVPSNSSHGLSIESGMTERQTRAPLRSDVRHASLGRPRLVDAT